MGLLLGTASRRAQESPTITPTVFQRYSDRVVKIQVVEAGSGAKSTVGSGFYIDDRGHIITNYHVVSDMIHSPERYRAQVIDGAVTTDSVAVLSIDVVHDVALLQGKVAPHPHFTLGPATTRQGERLYALGHPHDLGLTIVEGVHNGLLEHTLYQKLHFTGSLNPGMSGGPTINADGQVIGINVSTAGNQVSFLVPVARAVALAGGALKPGYKTAARLLDDVGSQITAYQDVYLKDLFAEGTRTIDLGPYRVPTEPARFFRCWGDANRRKEQPYESSQHQCSTDDVVFIAGDQESGIVEVRHELLTTTSLNVLRFYSLYSSEFSGSGQVWAGEDHVTEWRCQTRNVRNETVPLRAVLCVRRYKKLGQLYDALLKVAVLGHEDSGLVSTLTLSGVTFSNVTRLTRLYLDRITWH